MQETQEKSFFKFQLEGEFVGFFGGKPGKVKYLRLAVGDRELAVKLAKELRTTIAFDLNPGDLIQVSGEKELKDSLRDLKLKAYEVKILDRDSPATPISTSTSTSTSTLSMPNLPAKKKGKILLCQKSGCLKRGGKKLHEALQDALRSLDLQDSVTIEATSCQKRCKRAPNMVVLPGKTKYSQVPPSEVASVLAKHYLEPGNKGDDLSN